MVIFVFFRDEDCYNGLGYDWSWDVLFVVMDLVVNILMC